MAWGYQFLMGLLLLLAATQLVLWVLNHLEKRAFGTVALGTTITPLCTGFPNLMIGLFGQERLQGDLVLQLNIGNNIANTSLVVGLILFLAGPLWVRAGKGKSKKAVKAVQDQGLAFGFLWFGSFSLFWLARDGLISRWDGLGLVGIYFMYQILAIGRRGTPPKKKRLGWLGALWVLLLLGLAAWLIQLGVDAMGRALDQVAGLFPGGQLGLFLGLLTVVPESFLLLRLAFRQGGLGISGLVGDCLVSIPLVVGLSSCLVPIITHPVQSFSATAARPYLYLALTLGAVTLLSFWKKPVPRKIGLVFMLIYGLVWLDPAY